MAKKLVYNYTFTPGGAGAGTIEMDGKWLERSLLLITNVTDNVIIYNFAGNGLGGTTSYNSTTHKTVLTLDYSTSTMSASDELQIFVDQEHDEVEFGESFVDPVHKLRVSTPENLIDTDFEYGLQSSKWETLELVDNIPSIYSSTGGVSIGEIITVNTLANTQTITVNCGVAHELSIGDPIEVQGLKTRTAEGKYLVTNILSTTSFTYKSAGVQSTTGDIKTAYTVIVPGTFFSASDIVYDRNEAIATDNASPSTLTFTTGYNHGLSTATSLYITNTVGKRSYVLSDPSATAPDGDPYQRTSDDSFYIPNHKLNSNQKIYVTPDTGSNASASLPGTDPAPIQPLDENTCQACFDAVSTALDNIQTTMGTDSSRIYHGFNANQGSNSLQAYYTSGYWSNVTSGDGLGQTDQHRQYMMYGDYGYNRSAYMTLSTGVLSSYYRWNQYGTGNSTLYTGTPIDAGSLFTRYSGSVGESTLAGKGMYWCSTAFNYQQYTPYILQIRQFPDPAVLGNDPSIVWHQYTDPSYQTKRTYGRYNTTTTGSINNRQNAGDGWYYTYNYTYYYPQGNYPGFVSMYINLDNVQWSGQYGTGQESWSNQYNASVWALWGQMSQSKGSMYRIEVLLPIDDDVSSSRYGPNGNVLNIAQMVSQIVNEVKSTFTSPSFPNAANTQNIVYAGVVNGNRITFRNADRQTYQYLGIGTGPWNIETDQTTGIVDDYYDISGITSTTVSIASSNQIPPRVLEFSNPTGIQTYNSVPFIYIPGGHGLSDGQKVVFNVTSGTTPSGITNGNTYYAIVADNEYVSLADSVINWQNRVNVINDPAGGVGDYNLTVNSISGRVAAAGTIGITTDTALVVNGYGTKFRSSYQVGDDFVIRGTGTPANYLTNVVSSVVSDTKLELSSVAGITTDNAQHFVDTKINVRADGSYLHRPFDGGVEITAGTSPDSSIVRQTRKYFRYQSGKGIQCSVAINFNPYKPAERVQGSGSTVTVTTQYPHGLSVGNTITFRGASDSSYNRTTTVTAVTDFTFQYAASGTVSETDPTGFMEYVIASYSNAAVRCGLFDFQNGFFYEYDGSTLYAVRRSSVQQLSGSLTVTTGQNRLFGSNTRFLDQLSSGDMIVVRGQSYKITHIASQTEIHVQPKYRGSSQSGVVATKTIDTKVAQSNWSIDVADGTGPSGFNLNINNIQMAYFDYSWYGAGKIRFGFKDTTGRVRYCHEFIHNNRQNEAYMRSGNVPARYEVRNTGTPTFVPTLFHWGTSVIMDGRFDDDDSYLFTASGNSLIFTNGSADTATTTGSASVYRQRVYGSYSNYYLRIPFGSADAAKFSAGIALYTSDGQLNGETVSFTGYSGSTFYVYIYLSSGYSSPAVYPSVGSGTAVNIGAPSAGGAVQDLNILIPLISVRLAPSVDNSLIGGIGDRDIINRMQLKLKELGVSVSHDSTITVVLNGNLSNVGYQNVGSPSLSQYVAHESGDEISGGTTIYQFRASGGTENSAGKRFSVSSTFSLDGLADLGNSILGGDGVFPNGPDIMTICATPVDSSEIDETSSYAVSSRISWAESQA